MVDGNVRGVNRLGVLIPSMGGGGAERVVLSLLKGFVSRGVEVDLLLVRDEGPLLGEVPEAVRVVPLRGGRIAASLPSLVSYLRRQRPDALLSHLDSMNVVALLACRLSGHRPRTVVTTHIALSRHAAGGSLRQRLTRRIIPHVYPWADAVVGVSKGVTAELERLVDPGRTRLVTVYNPVVPDDVASASEEESVVPAGFRRMLLSVGRLTRQKNQALLVDAAAGILEANPDMCLLILGEGPERPRLEERIARHGLDERIVLAGFVPDPTPYYRQASLFVLSSDWEGLPTVLIEALSHGCPVVSTRCPSGPEEILEAGRFGRLVEPGDPGELAEAITAEIENPTPAELLRDRARDFGAHRSVSAYLDLLFPEGRTRERHAPIPEGAS